jgi:hypothetical protein
VRRPWWRRALTRWAPQAPRLLTGGLVAAAAVAAVWWRTNRTGEPGSDPVPAPHVVVANPPPELSPAGPLPEASRAPSCDLPEAADVTADLALDAARRSGCYAAAVRELIDQSVEIRAGWTADQQAAFGGRVAALREAVDRAGEGRSRHRAWRSMIRYVQNALVRDEVVALAGGATP